MGFSSPSRNWLLICILVGALTASGCGGGGGGVTGVGAVLQGGTLSGQAVKGPFQEGAAVSAFTVEGGRRGRLLGTGTTDAAGNFTVPISDGSYSGPVILEVTGNFFDEATGTIQSTGPNPLRGFVPFLAAGGTISDAVITPLTHLALALAEGSGAVTQSSLDSAIVTIGQRFGVPDPQLSAPISTGSAPPSGSTTSRINHSLVLAGLSQEAASLGVQTMTLINAASNDAADGTLDGSSNGNAITMATNTGGTATYGATTLSSDLAEGINTFLGSSRNGTGITSSTADTVELTTQISTVNQAPVAVISASPDPAEVGQVVTLSASGSADPEGQALTYLWTVVLGGSSITVTGATQPTATFSAAAAGIYQIQLTVTDTQGASNGATRSLAASAIGAGTGGGTGTEPSTLLSVGTLVTTAAVQPGASFNVTLPVTNRDSDGFTNLTASLSFDVAGITATASSANVSTLAPGATAQLAFTVTVPSGTAQGLVNVSATASATVQGSTVTRQGQNTGAGAFSVINTPIELVLGTMTGVPSQVGQGEAFTAVLPVTNPGFETAVISSISLDFGALLSVVPTTTVTSIAAGQTAQLNFSITVPTSAQAGPRTAAATVRARGASTSAVLDATRSGVAQTTVLRRAALRAASVTLDRSSVSQGQSFNVILSLVNDGEVDANITSVGLTFSTTQLSVAPDTASRVLTGGTSLSFAFLVDTSTAVDAGSYRVNGTAIATDSRTGGSAPFSARSPAPVIEVQTPAALSIASFSPTPKTLSFGQTVRVTGQVSNTGLARAVATTFSLSFSRGSTDLTSTFAVAADATNPTSVAGAGTATYLFDVTVPSAAGSGSLAVTGKSTGQDGNTGAAVGAADRFLDWVLQSPASLSVLGPNQRTVSQGQTFAFPIQVQNTGEAATVEATTSLVLTGTGITVTAPGPNSTIASLATTTYAYTLAVDSSAPLGPQTATFVVTGKDANSGAAVTDAASPGLTVTVQSPAALSVSPMQAPTLVSLGQTFLATVTVTNTGQAAATVTSATLGFVSSDGFTVTPLTVPAQIPGLSSANVTFQVEVALGSTLSVRAASFTLSAQDSNSQADASQSLSPAGAVQVVSPGVLAIANISGPAMASRGQGFVTTVDVQNTGQNLIIMTTGTLSFSGGDLAVTPRANPTQIAGGQIVSFEFDVAVSPTAVSGPRTASVTLTAREAGTGQDQSASRADAGTVVIQTPASVVLDPVDMPAQVSQGQTFRATAPITNSGEATFSVTSNQFDFDDESGFTITQVSIPGSVTGTSTGLFVYEIQTSASATNSPRTLKVTFTGEDANSAEPTVLTSNSYGVVTVQTPADVSSIQDIGGQTFINQGRSGALLVAVSNTGQAAASVSTMTLTFDDPTGLNIRPRANPSVIAGLATTTFFFDVDVNISATEGVRTASVTLNAQDANSNFDVSQLKNPAGTLTVQRPSQLIFAGPLNKPATVSQGQSFVASYVITNTGETGANVTTGTLAFSGTGLTVTPRSNPTSLAGAASGTYSFDVLVDAGATTGTHSASATVSATDANTSEDRSISTTTLGSIQVQTPAALTAISDIAGPDPVSQGQTFTVTVGISNTGQATANVGNVTLSFDDLSDLTVTASGSNPSSIAGTSTGVFSFDITVGASAVPGVRTASVTVAATDANSGADVSTSRSPTGTFTIQSLANVTTISNILPSTTASLGQSIALRVDVQNIGSATASITTVTLSFDDITGLTITPRSNPTQITGGASQSFFFDVVVDALAPVTVRTANVAVTATDANSGADISSSKSPAGTLTLQTPALIGSISDIVSQSLASQGQSFTATVSVGNSGQAQANVTTVALSFDNTFGLTVVPRSNPTTIAGGGSEDFAFDITVSGSATTSTRNAIVTVTGSDSNSGAAANGTKNPAGSFTVQTPANVSTISNFSGPTQVSQGQSFILSVTVTNIGQAAASVTTVALTFDNPADLTISPRNNPTTIAGGTAKVYTFDVTAGASAAAGSRTAQVTVTAADANSGSSINSTDTSAGTLTIQKVANVTTISDILGTTTISQGQTVTLQVAVTNTGEATANITTVALSFDDLTGLTIVPQANPTSINGGAGQNFSFAVTASGAATASTRTAQVTVTATDGNSGASIDSSKDPAGTLTIQTPANLSAITDISAPSTASQGQFLSSVTVTVTNSGQAMANAVQASLGFDDENGFTITGGGTQNIAGGNSATYTFSLSIGGSANATTRTARVSASGTDGNSGSAVNGSKDPAGTIRVQTPPNLNTISNINSPSPVSVGQTFTVTFTIQNTGEATATGVNPTLTIPGVSITASGGNPTSIAGGATAVFSFQATATGAGTQTAQIFVSWNDANTGNFSGSTTKNQAGTLQILTAASPSILSITVPSTVSTAQTGVSVQVSVQNTGQATAVISSESLTFSVGGQTATRVTVLPLNIDGSSTGTITYSMDISGSAATGARDITATVSGTDFNSGASLSDSRTENSDFTVQDAVSLQGGDVTLTAPSGIDRGGSAINVTLRVTNTGANTADARLTSSSGLSFSHSGGNADAEYTVTAPSDLTTRIISGGSSEDFVFTVAAGSTARKLESVSISATAQATDSNSGASSSQAVAGSWIVREAAAVVLGQSGFGGGSANQGSGSASATGLDTPVDAYLDGTTMYVADSGNNRVLVYNSATSKTTGGAADDVFGQTGLTGSSGATTNQGMRSPSGVSVGSNTLVVADTANHRVLNFTLGSDKVADLVLGQADFTSGQSNRGSTVASDTLANPSATYVDGSVLYVADTGNNRVLIYNNFTAKSNGDGADGVLGQANFTSSSSGNGADQMNLPTSLWKFGNRLYVADTGNNRVLVFNSPSTTAMGPSADRVLGQTGFGASGTGSTASTMNMPQGVSVSGDTLYVADTGNHRVLVFEAASGSPNGDTADDVLGQGLLTTGTQNNTVSGARDEFSLSSPTGPVAVSATQVFIPDQGNNRILKISNP